MRIETLLNPEYWILNTRAARRDIPVVAGLAEAGAVLLLFFDRTAECRAQAG